MRIFHFFLPLFFSLLNHSHAEVREFKVALSAQPVATSQSPVAPNKGAAQAGGLNGFSEMLAREICRRAAVRCIFSNQALADILPGVEAGQFDLGFGNFLRTPEREMRVAFSDSIWRSSSRLLTKPHVAARTAIQLKREVTLDSLTKVRVGVVEGSVQQSYLQGIAKAHGLEVLSYRTVAELITALRDDRVEFLLMPVLSSYAMINREPAGSFEFVGPPVLDRGLGGTVHIAIPKQKAEVLLVVNEAIASMRADGTYLRIVRQFFPFSLD